MNNQLTFLQILDDAGARGMTLATLQAEFRIRRGEPISEGDARTALRALKGRSWIVEGRNDFEDVTWSATPAGRKAAAANR